MPELLVPVIISAAASASIEVSATVATIAAYAVTAATVAGLEFAADLFGDKQKTDVKQNYKQALPTRTRAYGYCKLGGAYYVATTVGTTLVLGFVHCEGPICGIREFWLGDVLATGVPQWALDGSAGNYPGRDKLLIDAQLGTAGQGTNPGLGIVPGWGASRRLAGLANTVMRCYLPSDPSKNFQKYYPSGVPALRVVLQSSPVFEPRGGQNRDDPSTWTFSENPGRIIWDYLVHPDGAALPKSRLNDASFAAFADVCDQTIAKRDGSTEVRYTIGQGTYDLTERKADVLKRLLAACDGELYSLPDGTIGIRGGVWVDPTVTITPAMVLGYTYQAGVDVLTAYDQLRIRYIDPNLDFQQVEGDPWTAPGSSGDVSQDFDARVVASYNQARRLAKIKMSRENPVHVLTLNCSIAAIDAFSERVIRVQLPDLSLDETFVVTRCEVASDCSGVTLDVSSMDATAYAWDPSQEGSPAPNPNTTATTYVIPAVTGLNVSLVRTTVSGNVNAGQIQVTAAIPPDTSLMLHAQYRVGGTTDWLDMAGNGAWSALSDIVNDGATYDIQVAYQVYGGQDGPFLRSSFTVEVDPTAPSPPVSIQATADDGAADLQAVASDSPNMYALRFYRGPSDDFGSARLISTQYGGPNGTFYYKAAQVTDATRFWATALNHSGLESGPIGPTTISA